MSRSCSPSSNDSASSASNSVVGRRPPSHRDQVVLRGIDADPVQPCVKRAISTERRECPVGLDERFLRHVLDFPRIADEPRQQPPEFALVLGDQQVECLLVAALRTLDQLLVNVAVSHRRPSVSFLIIQTLNGWLRPVYTAGRRGLLATTLLLETRPNPIGSASRRAIRATFLHGAGGTPSEPYPQTPKRLGREGVREARSRSGAVRAHRAGAPPRATAPGPPRP